MKQARSLGVLLFAATLAACGPSRETGESSAIAPVAPPPAFALPDISTLAPLVRDEIHTRHAAAEDQGAWGDLGLVLMAASFLEAADVAFRQAHAREPGALRWPYYLAQLHRRTGDTATAVDWLTRALALDPTHVPSLVQLGRLHLDAGRTVDATALFERALAVDATSAPALAGLGRAALAADDAAGAVSFLERAVALAPGPSGLHYDLAMAYRALGDRAKLEEHLRQRGNAEPSPPDPLMAAYTGVLRSTVAYERRGMQAMDAGRFVDAAAIFRDGLDAMPDDPVLRHRLGTALMMAGDTAGAVREFEATLADAPDFEKAHFGLAVIHGIEGRHDAAITRDEEALQARPNYLEAILGLAEALRVTGRLEESQVHFERAVDIDPAFADAWIVRGVVLAQLGRFQEARAWLERALLVHPNHPDIAGLLSELPG